MKLHQENEPWKSNRLRSQFFCTYISQIDRLQIFLVKTSTNARDCGTLQINTRQSYIRI